MSTLPDTPAKRAQAHRLAEWIVAHPAGFPLGLLAVTCLVVGLINPNFWQIANLYDLLRASVVTGLFALGVMVVLSSGGLDVSFTAIGALVMYTITRFVVDHMPDLSIVPILLASLIGGCALGLLNGILVNLLRAPALIITIATQYAFRGFLLTFIGTSLVMNIPASMAAFNEMTLVQGINADGQRVRLPGFFLIFAGAAVLTWLMLNKTLIGRAIYATGATPDIAARLGFDVARVRLFVFAWAGALAGLAGVLHVVSNRLANPFDLAGSELSVIAAVVIGGARITGGTGTVGGTVSGVLLITLIGSVLIQIGVPAIWRTAVIGAFILVGGIFYAWVDRHAQTA
ncbi:MAG: ABC transporter permease [Roseinatronobacter sp.]